MQANDEASSPEKICEHASRADLPATEVLEIGNTLAFGFALPVFRAVDSLPRAA